MRVRRLLLATTALTTTTLVAGCHHNQPTPVHGNPKGSHYDDAAMPDDAAAATPDNAGSGSGEAPPAK